MYAKIQNDARVIRVVTAAVAAAILFTIVAAALPTVAAQAATPELTFHSRLAESLGAEKFAAMSETGIGESASAHTLNATPIAPPAAPKTTSVRKSTSSGTASATTSGGGDAQSILARYIAKYPILAGTTVEYGDAKGYQAISYYKSGRIVISATHTASLDRIIGHEIWHVIDWRDNGVIDWGENIPPK